MQWSCLRLVTFIVTAVGVTADYEDSVVGEIPIEVPEEHAAPPRPALLEDEDSDEDIVSMLQVKSDLALSKLYEGGRSLVSGRKRSATPDMQVYTAVGTDEATENANKAKDDTLDAARAIREKLVKLAEAEVKEAGKHGKCTEESPKPTGFCKSALANLAKQKALGDEYVDAARQLGDKLVDQTERMGKKEEEKGRDMMEDVEAKIEDQVERFTSSVSNNADKYKGDVKAEGDALVAKAVVDVTEKPPKGKGSKPK